MQGKIAYFSKDGKIGFTRRELPEPEPGALLVRVLRSNICGSDVKNWKNGVSLGAGGDKTCQGHEFVGRILRLGEGVAADSAGRPVQVGDRIVAAYYITCGECRACRKRRYDQCENAYIHLGQSPEDSPHFSGTFATHYYIYPKQWFYKVPDSLSDSLAAGTNCRFSQTYYGLERLDIQTGETLLIQGAGPMGLYAVALAREKGVRTIVVDGIPQRLELARRFGADHIVSMQEYTTVEARVQAVKDLTKGRGPDAAVEVTGFAGAFEEGIQCLAPLGRYVIIGINVVSASAAVSPGYITRKALTVSGVARYLPEYLNKSLEFLEKFQDKYPFQEFTEQSFGLEELEDALRITADRRIEQAFIVPEED